MVAMESAAHTVSAGTGRPSIGGRALVLRTQPRSTGSRPWRASIPIAESARRCRIRSAGSLTAVASKGQRLAVTEAAPPSPSANSPTYAYSVERETPTRAQISFTVRCRDR